MVTQLPLDLARRTWGGKRLGAGRKKSGTRHDSPHRKRPLHVGRHPVHVVLRARKEVGRLRRREIYKGINRALRTIAERVEFRVAHISIQHNHIHLLVEAGDQSALSSGMRSLTISLARRINGSLGRKGKVFAVRYHSTALTSPRQTRNALAYVLNNWRRHREDERGLRERTAILDPYSSAISFTGWADFQLTAWPSGYVPLPVATAQTWLLSTGWQLARRPIRTWDTPGPID